jgi:hypothetical protein
MDIVLRGAKTNPEPKPTPDVSPSSSYGTATSKSTNRPVNASLYYLAGYFTLFTFRNPIVGSKLRICQALVWPSQQKKGLGKELLLATYRLALSRDEVTEVWSQTLFISFIRRKVFY